MASVPRSNRKVLVLPGDGIGPEIMGEVIRVIDYFDRHDIVRFEVSQGKVGGASYDAAGTPLTDETLAEAMAADAVLFGSVGGPKWESLPFELQPERGLLRLRKEMDLFANLRPAGVFDALADASAFISANLAESRRSPTAASAASTPRSTPRPRSSGSCAPGSSWRRSASAA
jgi:isocitrate/isopropylmalate dehydrogenase